MPIDYFVLSVNVQGEVLAVYLVLSRVLALAGALASFSAAARAADAFDIPVVLPLTGNAAFLGQGEKDALVNQEAMINQKGGVHGRPIHYVFKDDQSSPQVAVQATSLIVANKPNVMIGSAIVAMCNAMAPLVMHGPVDYCLSPGIHPAAGSNVFTSFVSTQDLAVALVRYYASRGFKRLAILTTSDATGQDGLRGFTAALQALGNKDVQFVATEAFNPTDVSAAGQIEKIRSAKADALVVWMSGSPMGTALRAIAESGLDIPVGTTDANMTFAQMKQYARFLPKEMLYMSTEWSKHGSDVKLDPGVEAAQKAMNEAYEKAGQTPDVSAALAWDPGLLVISALEKLGFDAKPEQIRAYLSGIKGWAGINGLYDFQAQPQRGLDVSDCVVTRWEPEKNNWVTVSKPGGAAL